MTDVMILLCTCASREEARRIAEALVEERLAACVTVLPPVESIYRWQGKVERAEELQILVKSTSEKFPALSQRITELHSYDTPEILAVPIAEGSARYLAWLHEETSGGAKLLS
jgi:periplasmic divalent cation tolerance protein